MSKGFDYATEMESYNMEVKALSKEAKKLVTKAGFALSDYADDIGLSDMPDEAAVLIKDGLVLISKFDKLSDKALELNEQQAKLLDGMSRKLDAIYEKMYNKRS